MHTRSLAAIAALSASSSLAAAGGLTHTGDILLSVDEGRIVTSAFVSGAFQPQRVFDAKFGLVVPNLTNDPGFDCLPGTFPVGTAVGFRILDQVRRWNGTDFSTLSPFPIEISFATLSPVSSPATPDTTVQGFTVGVSSTGVWHRHLVYALDFAATNGVYLLKLELFNTSPAIADSEPFWMVFDQNATLQDFTAAVAWAQANLGVDAPACPGDANGDGVVNFSDLNAVLSAFGQSGAGIPGDVNGDGVVNFSDLNETLSNFGVDCN
ncbi:MAG: hypothetical protein KF684_06525 [Phycisphaeraceae bacterium]|nr:hypothetical protein [Phycisphaeraceae bacterium]